MKNRFNKIVGFTIYLLFVLCMYFTGTALAKYISSESTEIDFQIGSTLFFNYERHELFRNDQLIVGVEVEYEEDGEKLRRIETMNVVPGDSLTYHFFVSNYDLVSGEKNAINGIFFPNAKATLALPMKGSIYDVECSIQYREVILTEDSNGNIIETTEESWTNLVNGAYINLPPVDEEKDNESRRVKYEFRISVIIDDQVEDTTSDDYFDATLSIKLFINAASDN